MRSVILSAFGLAAALISTSPVAAQDQVQVHVFFGDLNLADSAGAARFKARMDQALTQICGSADPRDIGAVTLVRACRDSNGQAIERQTSMIIAQARTARPVILATAGAPR